MKTLITCIFASSFLVACGGSKDTPTTKPVRTAPKAAVATQAPKAPEAKPTAAVKVAKEMTPAQHGAKIYKRCRSCHTLEQDGRHSVGPNLWGIYGSKTASKEGYAYSKAMKAADITWDDKTLDEYLKKPAAYLPGTKMTFIGLKKQEDRDALQVFLKKKTEP